MNFAKGFFFNKLKEYNDGAAEKIKQDVAPEGLLFTALSNHWDELAKKEFTGNKASQYFQMSIERQDSVMIKVLASCCTMMGDVHHDTRQVTTHITGDNNKSIAFDGSVHSTYGAPPTMGGQSVEISFLMWKVPMASSPWTMPASFHHIPRSMHPSTTSPAYSQSTPRHTPNPYDTAWLAQMSLAMSATPNPMNKAASTIDKSNKTPFAMPRTCANPDKTPTPIKTNSPPKKKNAISNSPETQAILKLGENNYYLLGLYGS